MNSVGNDYSYDYQSVKRLFTLMHSGPSKDWILPLLNSTDPGKLKECLKCWWIMSEQTQWKSSRTGSILIVFSRPEEKEQNKNKCIE